MLELYEKDELTNVINRVVENINHSFTRRVVEDDTSKDGETQQDANKKIYPRCSYDQKTESYVDAFGMYGYNEKRKTEDKEDSAI